MDPISWRYTYGTKAPKLAYVAPKKGVLSRPISSSYAKENLGYILVNREEKTDLILQENLQELTS